MMASSEGGHNNESDSESELSYFDAEDSFPDSEVNHMAQNERNPEIDLVMNDEEPLEYQEYTSSGLCDHSIRAVLPPREPSIHTVTTDSVSLSWQAPDGLDETALRFKLTWATDGEDQSHIVENSDTANITHLKPGREYEISLATVGSNNILSSAVSVFAHTDPSPPEGVRVEGVQSTSLTLCWNRPVNMEGVSYTFRITYFSNEREKCSAIKESDCYNAVLTDLRPGMLYSISIATVVDNSKSSTVITTHQRTKTVLNELKHDLGIERTLSSSTILEIDEQTMNPTDTPIHSLKSLLHCFLRKLMMVNVTARHVSCTTNKIQHGTEIWHHDIDMELDDGFCKEEANHNGINPLDLITALFLSSDGLLQQELALKMSLCQFSVPLLLPNCDTQHCTLMLWALRDIVKRFRPHSLQESRGYVENSIVDLELPMVSFVRLGRSSLSKSHILNHILSSPQDYHDIFVHHNMKNGNIPRKVSDGLVEISWYLPSGNKNTDIFPEPVAVANLRGDISSFETQFSFLCQTSAAVFVFCDELGQNKNLLKPHDTKAQIFLICNSQSPNFSKDDFKKSINDIQFDPDFVLLKNNSMNSDEFVKKLRLYVDKITKSNSVKMNIEDMSSFGHQCEILVDEDCDHCLKAKQNAEALTKAITDISQFKEEQLPLHTKNQKVQATLADTDGYIITPFMTQFVSALSVSREERAYFLRWMKVLLDNLSRKHLSELLKKYKLLNASWMENKENRAHLHKELSRSSLGIEHFLREMGYLYELACSSPECSAPMQKIKQFKQLPLLYAEMMLDGFPLELVDGDSINISQKWVSEVMNALHPVLRSSSKLRVITVLGVENSGKSTLLNTMFGVQIAVSGRSSRGAFMFLLRLNESFRQHLDCDFIVVINTKCLRSSELVQPHDSYEDVYKMATVVARLSDITVINTAMENVTELKDILQGVIHAFLYMKTVGQNPCCLFVQHNVADVSAYEKNLIHRKVLLEQLNMMTEKAAQVKNVRVKSFTDIVEYDTEQNNWYIPGVWHGLPAMASVSVGYSEAVAEIKKKITEILKEKTTARVEATTVEQFLKSTNTLWNEVKDGSV